MSELSLFDRLLDDAPDAVHDVSESRERSFERFKLGLRRDLEGLLNSKRPFSPWLGRHDQLGDTVVGFGLPDLSTEDFGTPAVRERIRRMIAACIRTYETRLTRVEVDVDGAPTSSGVRFRITAVLRAAGIEEAVTYDARIRASDRAIAVGLAGKMIDDLIEYYQRELTFLRTSAGAFADAYPKIASRLRLTREAVEDPHIGRLIESVAFMNARLRHKIDDEFPELSDALLTTLYPHLIQPVPSFVVARLQSIPDLDKAVAAPRGTMLVTEAIDGEPCRYRLCWDTTLLPLRLETAAMGGPPLDAPALGLTAAQGVLRLTLTTAKPEIELAMLELDQLRLYIKSDARRAQILIEQFGANLLGIGVGSGPTDPRAVLLPPTALRLMGIDGDELLLPQTAVANLAYAALQEHFAYPQKHMFIEVSGLAARTLDLAGPHLDLFFYFDKLSPELERVVRADDFELFACPAINLFEMEAEPVQINHSSIEYRLIPDARREHAIEVHSVAEVILQDATGTRTAAPPLYAIDRGSARLGRMFHAVTRRSSFGPGGGDDVFLSVADLDGRLLADDTTVAAARILVTNRDLPARLPFGGGRPALSIADPVVGLSGASALTKPTPTRRPARGRGAVWKLIGQLSLNHLSLAGGSRGAAALREVLALYDLGDTPETTHLRERLVGVSATPGVARLRLRGHTAICAGVDVLLEIDDERLSGSGAFLLCTVVERFLAASCALNSFVRVSARLRREAGLLKTWPPRVGDRPLI